MNPANKEPSEGMGRFSSLATALKSVETSCKKQSKTQNKMQFYIKIPKNEENCKPFGKWRTGEKYWGC